MKKKKIVIVVVVVLALVVLAYFAWDGYLSPSARALARVKASLNDPGSAVFRNVTYSSKSKEACGAVNAKNRMGGYVGFTEFIVAKDGTVTFRPTADVTSGSPDDRIEALKQQIAFLKLLSVCTTKQP